MNPGSQNAAQNISFEQRLTAAIEHQPMPLIKADFATRVTAHAMTLPRRSRTARANFARTISILFSLLLLVALFLLAPHAQPSFSSLSFDLELTVVVVLSALAYGLTHLPAERQ